MKTLIPLIILVVGCATHAQQPSANPAPPPPPHSEDVLLHRQDAVRHAQDALQHQQDAIRRQQDALLFAQAPVPGLPPTAPVPPKPAKVRLDFDSSFGFALNPSSSSRRTLVIPKGEPNPDFLANAEEDLNVMSVILERAVEMRSDDEGKKAMGIDIFSSSSGIKNLLIEGQGAIFTLKTKIALVPPPAPKSEEVKEKESATTEWDEARRALYGPSEIEREIHRAWGKAQVSFSSSEEYDEKKLQRLKDSLAESLKSASNIRALSGDQTVTVVVFSSSPVGEVRRVVAEAGRGGGGGGRGGVSSSGRRAEIHAKADREPGRSENRSSSRLLLQAKKSDIDAYAKGKLNSEAFGDKVKVQIY